LTVSPHRFTTVACSARLVTFLSSGWCRKCMDRYF